MKKFITLLSAGMISMFIFSGCMFISVSRSIANESTTEETTKEESSDESQDSKYSDSELLNIALDYCELTTGHRPDHAEIDDRNGDEITIHLYDDEGDHVSTVDWYTINVNTGEGTDFLGEEISIFPQK